MLVEIIYPALNPRSGTCFLEVARRRGDYALAGAAAIVTLDEERQCKEVRLALCGVGETPVDVSDTVASLVGTDCSDKAIDTAAADVQGTIEPFGNVHATADYQRHIAGVLVKRTLATALQRASHGI
jgi:carbon-monoxide dehydrogenase medium subunit